MPGKWIEGTFTQTKDQATVDFLIKTGAPPSEASKLLGTRWTMKLRFTAPGTILTVVESEDMPELNQVDTYVEGVEKEVDNPIFGGKSKLHFIATGENEYHTKMTMSDGNELEWAEKYTEEGLTNVVTHKKTGATFTEVWQREVQESGWFKVVKHENFENFLKGAGFPESMAGMFNSYKVRYIYSGNTQKLMEYFPGQESPVVNTSKLDEESTYQVPGSPEFGAKMVITKQGPGHYRMIAKRDKDGGKEDWDFKYTPDGLVMSGLDIGSGQKTTIWMERFSNIFGKFKLVASSGMEKLLAAQGVPQDMALEMANEQNAVATLTDLGDGNVRTKYESKLLPTDMTYKWGVEQDVKFPNIPGTFKFLATMEGDTVVEVTKGPKCTNVAKSKVTDNFLINTNYIVGSDIRATLIFERIY